MEHEKDPPFLRYFFRTYIPIYMDPLPFWENEYEQNHLRSYEIWMALRQLLHRMPLALHIKQNLFELFHEARELWMRFYLPGKYPYRTMVNLHEIQERWKKMQRKAKEIYLYAEDNKYL